MKLERQVKKMKMMKMMFRFSILALIWSIYYFAMHKTGGILTNTDMVVCGVVIVVCLIIIGIYGYKRYFKDKS